MLLEVKCEISTGGDLVRQSICWFCSCFMYSLGYLCSSFSVLGFKQSAASSLLFSNGNMKLVIFWHGFFFRQAWALVSVVGGGNESCSEDVREHENLNTGGRALATRNFTTVEGVDFSVSAYSEWKNGESQLLPVQKSHKRIWLQI